MHLLRNPGHAEGSYYLDTMPRRLGSSLPNELIVIHIRLCSLQLPPPVSDLIQLAYICLVLVIYWSNTEVPYSSLHMAFPMLVSGAHLTVSALEKQRLRLSRAPSIDVLTSANLILSYTFVMIMTLIFPRTTTACIIGLTILASSKVLLNTEATLAVRYKAGFKVMATLLLTAMYFIACVVASRVKVLVDLCLGKYPSDNHESLAQCVSLIQGRDFSLINWLKLEVEEITKVSWRWWPLSPTFQRQAAARSRIQWNCVSQASFSRVHFPILIL